MQEKIYITAGSRQCEYKAGTTFKEIAEDFQKEYKDEILLVKANFRLYELNNKAKSDTTGQDLPRNQDKHRIFYRKCPFYNCFSFHKSRYFRQGQIKDAGAG